MCVRHPALLRLNRALYPSGPHPPDPQPPFRRPNSAEFAEIFWRIVGFLDSADSASGPEAERPSPESLTVFGASRNAAQTLLVA